MVPSFENLVAEIEAHIDRRHDGADVHVGDVPVS
jgi:hypothetical protein